MSQPMTPQRWNPLRDLEQPLHWRKPRQVTVVGDLFAEDVAHKSSLAFALMMLATKHQFHVTTEGVERMHRLLTTPGGRSSITNAREVIQRHVEAHWSKSELLAAYARSGAEWDALDTTWPLPNLSLSVLISTQQEADDRIPRLLKTPAAIRVARIQARGRVVVKVEPLAPRARGRAILRNA